MKRPSLPDLGLVTADVLDAVSLERIQLKNKLRKNHQFLILITQIQFLLKKILRNIHSDNYSIITEKQIAKESSKQLFN
jgi:hypothetical protein